MSTKTNGDFVEPFDDAMHVRYRGHVDWTRYRRLIETAHAAGDARATYAMATWYLRGYREVGVKRQPKRAVPLLVIAARRFALAALELAFAYETGRWVGRRDPEAALRLYRKAVRLGSVRARYEVGRCYWWGIGTKKNERTATRFLRDAERLGYVDSELASTVDGGAKKQRR